MSLFVLEIGIEELPARFLAPLEAELLQRFTTAFTDAAIAHDAITVATTPRRAIVTVTGVNPVQQTREEVVTGPPIRAAYDNDGCPTKALEGFARTNNVAVEALFKVETDKGEYIAVHKHTGGAQVADLLQDICPAIISALPFAKRMRWGNNTFAFARPLRWIVALLDNQLIPFSVGPVASGTTTYGHRIHGAGPFTVPSADALLHLLSTKGAIVPHATDRRAQIIAEGNDLAQSVQGTILWKESLLDEVQGLCECPSPLMGDFDPSFLEVPRQVLLTSMESHQKSFGVQDGQGNLLPHFLTVLNLRPTDRDLVKRGWERVLRARLEDARFFWRTDLAASMDTWLHNLDSVIFLGPLGSMGDKTHRLSALCSWLANQCAATAPNISSEQAARAGRLSKADLVSGMVGEFDTLQGVMGGIYAERMGEDPIVAAALAEQYLPAGPDSPVATTPLGAILSMADKADTMVGCFGLGMVPTGTADPNGLRRCALGIARTILEHNFRVDTDALFRKAQELYGERNWKLPPEESLAKLHEFFGARLKNLFTSEKGQASDTLLVEAAMGAGFADVWATGRRLQALQNLHNSPEFVHSVQTFKRVTNIVRKQGQEASEPLTGIWKPELLVEDAEKALAAKLDNILPRFDSLWAADDYDGVLALIQEVRPYVDQYFEGVMVMCDDAPLRVNRLNILKAIIDRLGRLADFAALQI